MFMDKLSSNENKKRGRPSVGSCVGSILSLREFFFSFFVLFCFALVYFVKCHNKYPTGLRRKWPLPVRVASSASDAI